MSTMHPHWQAEDESQERPVRITTKSKNAPVRASRRPAALTGIALFALIGFSLIQGFSSLRGQLSNSPNLIHIKQESVDPTTITVQPGDTVTWVNESTIPHILTSDSLPTANNKHFETSPLFQGNSTRLLIPLNASPGTYTYISKTSKNISGQIVISTGPATSPAVTPTPNPNPSPINPSAIPPAMIPAPVTNSPSVPNPNPNQNPTSPAIPQNAHTVGNGENPLPPRQTGGQAADIVSHMPSEQTETGPAIWITITASVGGLLLVTRKYFRYSPIA